MNRTEALDSIKANVESELPPSKLGGILRLFEHA